MNELLFTFVIFIDILFILFSVQRGINWLFATIVTNLILIGIFGVKLVTVFGLITNAGNIFYACVFLGTYFILERYGRREGIKTIWFGISFVLFFAVLAYGVAILKGVSTYSEINIAINTLFPFSIRVVCASILAYAFAQYMNILIFEWIKKKTKGNLLWLRVNVANIVSQLLDSMIFFSIAFFDLPGPLLVQAILAGWLIKILVVFVGTPFLYIDTFIERNKKI